MENAVRTLQYETRYKNVPKALDMYILMYMGILCPLPTKIVFKTNEDIVTLINGQSRNLKRMEKEIKELVRYIKKLESK